MILTGAEGQEAERQRAERLAEKLRELRVNPDEVWAWIYEKHLSDRPTIPFLDLSNAPS